MYKLGRKKSTFRVEHIYSALVLHQHLATLPSPPANGSDYVSPILKLTGGNWGVDGNDQYGCCVEADCSHQEMTWTGNTSTMIEPSTQNTLDLYTAVTGFNPNDPNTDQGTDMVTMCDYLVKTGYMGSKLVAYAPMNPQHTANIMWGVQLFGTIKMGFNVPQSAMDQFNNNQIWDVVPGSQIVGGHDVPLVMYKTTSAGNLMLYCVTWGKVQPMTLNFFNTYCDEVIAPLSPLWINNTSGLAPSGFSMADLQSDLVIVKQ